MEKAGPSKNKQKTKPSDGQKKYLVKYLAEFQQLARNQMIEIIDGERMAKAKWKELADILNSMGIASKIDTEWKKYWDDLKCRTKKKYTKLKENIGRSGINGDNLLDHLDDCEKMIMDIISVHSVEGDKETQELGVENNNEIVDPLNTIMETPKQRSHVKKSKSQGKIRAIEEVLNSEIARNENLKEISYQLKEIAVLKQIDLVLKYGKETVEATRQLLNETTSQEPIINIPVDDISVFEDTVYLNDNLSDDHMSEI